MNCLGCVLSEKLMGLLAFRLSPISIFSFISSALIKSWTDAQSQAPTGMVAVDIDVIRVSFVFIFYCDLPAQSNLAKDFAKLSAPSRLLHRPSYHHFSSRCIN